VMWNINVYSVSTVHVAYETELYAKCYLQKPRWGLSRLGH
jgi:hypothetical protein